MLVRGVGAQVKRGLDHDYRRSREDLTTVRGRIDIATTLGRMTMTRHRITCEYDDYVADTALNRVVKSTIVLLIRRSSVDASRKAALRRLLPYFDAVPLVSPTSIRWSDLTYHRGNASYRLLLGVCELIVRGLLPTTDDGDSKLAEWLSDDAMSDLYERFLREYYAFHHPSLRARAVTVPWDYDVESAIGTEQLPAMRTDVTLRRGSRTLIIDAKYYGQNMQRGRWEKRTVRSGHLYQVLAYAKNADTAGNGAVSALLLYARTVDEVQPDVDVTVQGTRIGARTLDLGQPWETIRTQLEQILSWLNEPEANVLESRDRGSPVRNAKPRSTD
ncbi:5-methylcytosine restriction system specificity protein McrC [Brevibacterium samyangense]